MKWRNELECSRCDFCSDDPDEFVYIAETYEILCLECVGKDKEKK